jgi:hypothetical protein
MSAHDRAIGAMPAYPSLRMMLARQHVADLRRLADGMRRPRSPHSTQPSVKRLGTSSRLADGSWLYGRRDSS